MPRGKNYEFAYLGPEVMGDFLFCPRHFLHYRENILQLHTYMYVCIWFIHDTDCHIAVAEKGEPHILRGP